MDEGLWQVLSKEGGMMSGYVKLVLCASLLYFGGHIVLALVRGFA